MNKIDHYLLNFFCSLFSFFLLFGVFLNNSIYAETYNGIDENGLSFTIDEVYTSAPINDDIYNTDGTIPPLTYRTPIFNKNIDFIHIEKSNGLLRAATIPASYDSRDHGVITPVKNQDPYGTCWIFGTLATMEANYLSKNIGSSIDLSEYRTAWFSYDNYGIADPLGLMTNDGIEYLIQQSIDNYGFKFADPVRAHGIDTFDVGGNVPTIVNMLSSGIGVNDEVSGKTYNSQGFKNNPNNYRGNGIYAFNDEDCYDHDYILVNANYHDFSSINANESIKKIVMEKGAVTISMYYDGNAVSGSVATGGSFNPIYNSYYYPISDGRTNHAVVIVGWDDNFDKNKFLVNKNGNSYIPQNNGAWLIRNSWGTDWGDNGYFWVSYEDASIHIDKAYSFDIEKEDKNNPYNIYGTDGNVDPDCYEFGLTVNPSTQYNTVAQFYTPTKKETIEKIGLFVSAADSEYDVKIYTNIPKNINENEIAKIAMENDPAESFTKTFDYYGYHLVDVPNPVIVNANETYLVIFIAKKPGADAPPILIDYVSDPLSFDNMYTYAKTTIFNHNAPGNNWFAGVNQGDFFVFESCSEIFEGKYDIKLKVYTKDYSSNSSYTVEHYLENVDETYTKYETETFTGAIGSTVNAAALAYNGFVFDSSNSNNVISGSIKDDNSLVLKLYYKRNSYTLSFNTDGGNPISSVTYKYGHAITKPDNPTKQGYTFNKWNPAIPNTMPFNDLEVKAEYAPDNVDVHILHYLLDVNGVDFVLKDDEKKNLLTDSSITIGSYEKTTGIYSNFEYIGGIGTTSILTSISTLPSFSDTTNVLANGNRCVALFYNRKQYTLTLDKDNGINDIAVNSSFNLNQYYYDKEINLSAQVKPGYKFLKWKKDDNDFSNNTNTSINFNMPGSDVKYYAYSSPIQYKISYDLDDGSFLPNAQVKETVNYDEEFTVPTPIREGFSFTGWNITGLDNTTHIVDGVETTATSLSDSTSSKFKNLTTLDTGVITFTANYGPQQYQYTIEKYLMDLNGNYPSTPYSTDNKSGTFDSTIDYSTYKAAPEGFTFDASKSDLPEKVTTSNPVAKLYFSRNKYNLTISASGDIDQTITGSGLYYFDQDVSVNVTPSTGYHFESLKEGNTLISDNIPYSFKMPAKALGLTSICSLNNYTITFNLNYTGAQNPDNIDATYGNKVEIPNPTRVYYTFTGWEITGLDNSVHIIGSETSSSTSLSNIKATDFYNLTSVNNGTVNFKATWSANTIYYVVKIYEMNENGQYPNDNSPTQTITEGMSAIYGSLVSYIPNDKTGFTVDISKSVLEDTLSSNDIVLKVYYARNSHTITIQKDSGVSSVAGEGSHLFGETVNLTATIKPGYIFSKWIIGTSTITTLNTSYQMTDADITISIETIPITYKITYVLDDGSFLPNAQVKETVNYDEEFSVPTPIREGFSFTGWNISGLDSTTHIVDSVETTATSLSDSTASTFKNLTTLDTGVITFTALWSANSVKYTINYYVQDTTGNYVTDSDPYLIDEKEAYYGDSVTVTPNEIEGFTFDNDKTIDSLTQTINNNNNTVFNLYYLRNKYHIYLEKDDGIDSVSGECEDYYDATVQISCIPNKCYTFLKWISNNEDSSYDNESNVKILSKDTTYKAISKANTYNIVYELDGGAKGENSPLFGTYNTNLIVPHPIKPGYDFIGWYISGMDNTIIHYFNDEEYSESDYIEGDPIIGESNTKFKNLHYAQDADVTLLANWQARTDTPYSIEHYLEMSDGTYDSTPNRTESKTGTTATEATATYSSFVGYDYDPSSVDNGVISGDGSLKIKLYYKRKTYKIVYDGNGSTSGIMDDGTVKFNSCINMPVNKFIKTDSIFVGWQVEDDEENIKCIGDNQYVINEGFINSNSIEDTITVKAIWQEISNEPITIPGSIVSGESKNLTTSSNNLYKTDITNTNINEVLYPKSSSSSHSSVAWVEALACSQSKIHQISSALKSKNVNYKNIYCLDITLYMADDGDSSTGKKVSETYSPVNLNLDLSNYSELIESAKSDLLVVYFIHDGKLQDEIKGTFNKDNNTFSFKSSKFSTYALCALMPAAPSSDGKSSNEINVNINPNFSTPATGLFSK